MTYDSKWGQLREHPDDEIGVVWGFESKEFEDNRPDNVGGGGCESGNGRIWTEEEEVTVVVERDVMREADIEGGAERKKTDIFGPRWP